MLILGEDSAMNLRSTLTEDVFLPNTRHAGRRWNHEAYPRMPVFLRWIYAKQFHHTNAS